MKDKIEFLMDQIKNQFMWRYDDAGECGGDEINEAWGITEYTIREELKLMDEKEDKMTETKMKTSPITIGDIVIPNSVVVCKEVYDSAVEHNWHGITAITEVYDMAQKGECNIKYILCPSKDSESYFKNVAFPECVKTYYVALKLMDEKEVQKMDEPNDMGFLECERVYYDEYDEYVTERRTYSARNDTTVIIKYKLDANGLMHEKSTYKVYGDHTKR